MLHVRLTRKQELCLWRRCVCLEILWPSPFSKGTAWWAIHSCQPVLYFFFFLRIMWDWTVRLRLTLGDSVSHWTKMGLRLRARHRASLTPAHELSSMLQPQCRLQSTALWLLSWAGRMMDISCANGTVLFTLCTSLNKEYTWYTHQHTHREMKKSNPNHY